MPPLCATKPHSAFRGDRTKAAAIRLIRYEEDWSSLCNSETRSDFLDPLKCMSLRALGESSYLSLGGEFRGVYEDVLDDNWSNTPYPANSFWLEPSSCTPMFISIHIFACSFNWKVGRSRAGLGGRVHRQKESRFPECISSARSREELEESYGLSHRTAGTAIRLWKAGRCSRRTERAARVLCRENHPAAESLDPGRIRRQARQG